MVREQAHRLPPRAGAVLGVAADEPHEDRDERQREHHHPGRERVDRDDERENRDGDDQRRDEIRQIAREGRIEGVHARDRGRRELGALRTVERRRPVPEARLDEVEPQLRDHLRRGAPAGRLESPRGDCAGEDHDHERAQRPRDVRKRRAAEGPRRDPRQEHRLREHEQGGDDAEERVGHQERSHRPRATEQARIEGGDLRHGRP